MRILIDVPDKEYEYWLKIKNIVSEYGYDYHNYMNQLQGSVVDGIPLPKEHGRLIDADMLITELKKRHDFFVNKYGSFNSMLIQDKARADEIRVIKGMMLNAPTIIEADKESEDQE